MSAIETFENVEYFEGLSIATIDAMCARLTDVEYIKSKIEPDFDIFYQSDSEDVSLVDFRHLDAADRWLAKNDPVVLERANRLRVSAVKLVKNDRLRNDLNARIKLPPRDGKAAVLNDTTDAHDDFFQVDESQLAEHFKSAETIEKELCQKENRPYRVKKWAATLIDDILNDEEPDASALLEKEEQIEAILAAAAVLKPRDREVVVRVFSGMRVWEIAEDLNKTPSAIYSTLNKIAPILKAAIAGGAA